MLRKIDQKRFKNTFLKEKIAFERLYSQKNRACGAAILCLSIIIIKIVPAARPLLKQVSDLQATIALSAHAQNTFYSVDGALTLGYS